MSSKKRKCEDEGNDSEQKRIAVDENNHEDTNASDCDPAACSNSVSEQKSDNGGESQQPGPSENSDSPEANADSVDNESNNDDDEKKSPKTENTKPAGTLLFSGGTNWDLIGRKELPKNAFKKFKNDYPIASTETSDNEFKVCEAYGLQTVPVILIAKAKGAVGPNLWGPHRLSALKGIRVAFAVSGCTACHSVIITDQGKVMTWGRNDKGQLGHCDTVRRDIPCLVETLKEHYMVSAACGRSHTLFLSDRSIVYSCGDNKMGQCGVGSQTPIINVPTKVTFKGKPVTKIACGAEFSAIIDGKGGLYTFGLPEYGQLGHNSDGRYFVTSNKLSFRCELVPRRVIAFIEKTREGHVTLIDDVQIVDIACGINHSVVVDTKKRCFSWGFGGYGRLGHAEQKDEFVPRLIKSFDGPNRGVRNVYAGSTYSMAVNEYDVLFFWGQNKRAGEATMYPKPVQDLTGWKVRDAACGYTSIVVLADESLITWGPSPTYGELCYGEKKLKSSTTPQEAKTVEGLHLFGVACGYGHTLLIARDETEEDKAKLEELPEFTP